MTPCSPSRPVAQRGFGLVELMVGMVIALFATLAIFQTFAVSEEQRRTTSSGSEGLQAGTLAFNQLRRMVQNAGFDMVTPTDTAVKRPARLVVPGSATTIINATATRQEFLTGCTTQDGLRIAPVTVSSGGGGKLADTLTIVQGSSSTVAIPSKLKTGMLAGTTDLTITSTYGFQINDWVLVYEQNSDLNPGHSRPVPCTLAKVLARPLDPAVAPAVIRLSTGTAANYTENAQVANLGPNPLALEFTVLNDRLQARNLFDPGSAAQIIADHVIAMKVQTGIDVGNDDIIDEWTNPPASASAWLNPPSVAVSPSITTLPVAGGARSLNQIKALRIGLLIRSPRIERPDAASNTCAVSSAGPWQVLPAVSGDAGQRIADMPGSGDYTLDGEERCYRYNTVTGVIALRNLIVSDL